eukprot:320689_1
MVTKTKVIIIIVVPSIFVIYTLILNSFINDLVYGNNIDPEIEINNNGANNCHNLINASNIRFKSDLSAGSIWKHPYPPYLASFPGSGNSYLRLLIEYITNIYSGSIYDDHTLLKTHKFLGEKYCLTEVSVIEIHPSQQKFAHHYTDKRPQIIPWINNECICGCNYKKHYFHKNISFWNQINTYYINKYKKNTMSAIFIVRNPWNTLFSRYTMIFNMNEKQKTKHSKRIELKSFEPKSFRQWLFQNQSKKSQFKQYVYNLQVITMFKEKHYDHIIISFEAIISKKKMLLRLN